MKLVMMMKDAVAPATDLSGILEQNLAALRDYFGDDLIGVALYGSQARGEADERSDTDLLVIVRGLPDHPVPRSQKLVEPYLVEKWFFIRRAAITPFTPEQFTSGMPSYFLEIGLDAVVLYDPSGWLAEKLARIREIIEEAGLYRIREPWGLVWRWKRRPQGDWRVDWDGFYEQTRSAVSS